MADFRALEAEVHRNFKGASADDLDHLARHYWQAAKAEPDYRSRQKLLKRASHYAGHAFARGIEDPDTLRRYMEIARHAAEVHSFPQDERRKLSQITARWLALTGAAAHAILAQTKGRVATETASFALGDVGIAPNETDQPWSESEIVEWMNKGQRLIFATGYDGEIKAELRVIEGVEPVLAEKEYKKLQASTPTIVLTAPTGRIALADYAVMMEPWHSEPPDHALVVDALPGSYKVCVFGFSTGRWDAAIAVACRTEETPPNAIGAIHSLFM